MLTRSLRPYYLMGALVAGLLAVAAGAGLVVPDLYKSYLSQGLISFQLIQDTMSLILALALAPIMYATARGSRRALVIWAGLMVFVAYYYAFFAFGKVYTPFYPLYLALTSLGTFTLVGLLIAVDLPAFARQVRDRLPVRFIAIVLGMPLLLAPLWLAMMFKAIATQQIEETALVYVMDLGFLIPACLYAAVQLWRRRPIGYLLSGVLLVKAVLSGVLLGLGELQKSWLGGQMAVEQFAMWVFLSVAGSVALALYLRRLGQAAGQAAPGRAVRSGSVK